MQVDTLSKQLLFTTIKITNNAAGVVSFGTGFLVDLSPEGAPTRPIVITNKHVIANADTLSFRFVGRMAAEDKPEFGTGRDFAGPASAFGFVGHPDPGVDIAAAPLSTVINKDASGIFFRTIPRSYLPTEKQGERHDALEEITFVGYPNGHADPFHYTPIIRRGITATPMGLRFGGREVFLVDGSVFGGSSGSPVFLYNQGSYGDGRGNMVIGTRLQLVGIMAETLLKNTELPLAVTTQPHVKLAQELNLGVAFNWKAIVETISELERVYSIQQAPIAEADIAQPE